VLFSGVCALILAMGIARYSFTPMIPYMANQVGMTESLAGWLAGWNYIGYLTGLFMVWLLRDLKAQDYFYRYGLFIAVFSTAIMGFHEHSLIWYLSRFFAGVSTALVFMLGTGLIATWLNRHGHKEDLGLHFSGLGLGIIIGALIVEFGAKILLDGLGWQGQWLVLAAFGAVFAIPAVLLLPFPDQEQLDEFEQRESKRSEEPSKRWLLMITAAYICAGFSNTINVTFTSLIAEYVPLKDHGTLIWIFVGIAAAPAPFIWEKIAHKVGYLQSIRFAFIINIISNLLMTFFNSFSSISISSFLFGFSFMGIVSLTLKVIAYKYRYRATQVMAQLTLGYCLAQIVSPIMSGIAAEMTGSFNLPLYIVSAIMVVGLICLSVIKQEGRLLPSLRQNE
jgi:predicted MFS family arabinose efflux permease